MTESVDSWIGTALAEVGFEAQRCHPENKASMFIVLRSATGDSCETPAVFDGAEMIDGFGSDFRGRWEFPDSSATTMHVLWAELVRALSVATGRAAPTSLVVSPANGFIVAWWPEYCSVHGSPKPVSWYAVRESRDDVGAGPGADATVGPGLVQDWFQRWGIEPPTRAVDCGDLP